MSELKQKVYTLCQQVINQRKQTIRQAMEAAQASANEETKSSAGDKYETGRAMMQLEMEKNATQLAEANKLSAVLDLIDPVKVSTVGQLGSLVTTSMGVFYLSISAGQVTLGNTIIFAISPASPLGMKLMGLQQGDTFLHQGKTCTVLTVE